MSPSFIESIRIGPALQSAKGLPDISPIQSLDIEQFVPGRLEKRWLIISDTALGPIKVPIFAYRGSTPGPTVGIVGAIHGNEVNGIPVIQQIFAQLDAKLGSNNRSKEVTFAGTIVGVPVLNVPGFLDSVRSFDGHDLNRLMPGYSQPPPSFLDMLTDSGPYEARMMGRHHNNMHTAFFKRS